MGDIYDFHNESEPSHVILDTEAARQEERLKDVPWYHGGISRLEAEKRIQNNGEFLVRVSEKKNDSKFVISTKWNGKFLHVIIKSDFDKNKNQLTYHITSRFKLPSVLELINFHRENQYPLSTKTEAALYRPIDVNAVNNISLSINGRESKYMKSSHVSRRFRGKSMIPRCGSETLINEPRLSGGNFSDLNKSLTDLNNRVSVDGPEKPDRPSFRLFSGKHLLAKMRPPSIRIWNKKLYKDGSDYSDYSQLKNNEAALERERSRRGLPLQFSSPSLYGFKDDKLLQNRRSSAPFEESVYIVPNGLDISFSKLSNTESSPSTKVQEDVETPHTVVPSANDFNIYGIPIEDSNSAFDFPTPKALSSVQQKPCLLSFVSLSLSSYYLSCCGPVEETFDKVAINKAAAFLLSNPNHHLHFCKHLVDEFQRIFEISSSHCSNVKFGFRSIFLPDSKNFQQDLTIRQTALANFIMATIVSTNSSEKRVKLIYFWIKCADYLLNNICDIYHFRSVVTAIFSEDISNLRVWKTVYKQDLSIKDRMESLRCALTDGSLLNANIHKCIPDIVQLLNVFLGNDEDFDTFSRICLDIMSWSDESFNDSSLWLSQISQNLDSFTKIPFFRELVQTETLLCLILGRSNISSEEVTPLLQKVEICINLMAKVCNENTM